MYPLSASYADAVALWRRNERRDRFSATCFTSVNIWLNEAWFDHVCHSPRRKVKSTVGSLFVDTYDCYGLTVLRSIRPTRAKSRMFCCTLEGQEISLLCVFRHNVEPRFESYSLVKHKYAIIWRFYSELKDEIDFHWSLFLGPTSPNHSSALVHRQPILSLTLRWT